MTASLFLPMGADSVLSVPLSREVAGLPQDSMAREGLRPELGSMDPALWIQNLSSLLLEEPMQTRGLGELWTLPYNVLGEGDAVCQGQRTGWG